MKKWNLPGLKFKEALQTHKKKIKIRIKSKGKNERLYHMILNLFEKICAIREKISALKIDNE